MSVASNKALIQRVFHEALNLGELAVVDEAFSPQLVDHASGPDDVPGPEGIKRFIREIRKTFPDLMVDVESIIGEGEQVASRESWRGTHAFTGQPAKGTVLHIFLFQSGQVVEEWSAGWEWLQGVEIISP